MKPPRPYSRRQFLAATAFASLGAAAAPVAFAAEPAEPIIDIHQHTHYHFRSDARFLAHQRAMGVTTTILLPAGRIYGLEAACGGNDTVVEFARKHPEEFRYFANEVADLPQAPEEIAAYLKGGAIGIGEQKFRVACDSPAFERVAAVAREHKAPILMHFQHGTYNTGIERFHKVLEKFPTVNFIGHAQTWWGNIDLKHDQTVLYPKGNVTPGGITDRLLSDYPNMYGDHSAGSGLNALTRDEEHMRGFLERHQDKLMFGSDCEDSVGKGDVCEGAQILAALRRLAPNKAVERKILYGNAKQLLRV